MKILKQFGLVVAICIIGELIAGVLPITFPASVIGMILLFCLLGIKFIRVDHVDQVSDFLLSTMSFFFIPAGVGIIDKFDLLKENLFAIILICIISTFITFVVTAITVNSVVRIQNKLTKVKD